MSGYHGKELGLKENQALFSDGEMKWVMWPQTLQKTACKLKTEAQNTPHGLCGQMAL